MRENKIKCEVLHWIRKITNYQTQITKLIQINTFHEESARICQHAQWSPHAVIAGGESVNQCFRRSVTPELGTFMLTSTV